MNTQKSAMPQTAMVMAAGLGTRMRPRTETIPKPLVPVAGKALVDYTLDFLAASGIKNAVVNSHYLAEMLESHLYARQVQKPEPQITISREEAVLETGGGIKNALPLLGNAPFFVINSDIICIDKADAPPALTRLWQAFDERKMDAILLLMETKKTVGYHGVGDFFANDNGNLRRRREDETAPLVFTGVQLIHPRLFANAPDGKFSLNVLYNRDISRLGAVVHSGDWLHIGSEAELAEAENWLNKP